MATDKNKIKILFLCTGNSCRSQMAEGWARHLKSDVIEAYSAGIRLIGLNKRAIKVMAEAGVDISMHVSKHVDELSGIDFDYVVTLCDNAAANCPVFGDETSVIHKPFNDPYLASGTEKEIMTVFRKVRDDIKEFIETMPQSLKKLA